MCKMAEFNCSEFIKQGKCKADCCGSVPIPKLTVKRFEHLQQRKVLEIVEWDSNDILPVTDGRCFL